MIRGERRRRSEGDEEGALEAAPEAESEAAEGEDQEAEVPPHLVQGAAVQIRFFGKPPFVRSQV